MNTIWQIATYEWRMQYRSLTFWLVALVLFAFLIGELLPRFQQDAAYATSAEPIIHSLADERTSDRITEARQAVELARFSWYSAWAFIDIVGLSSALFIGFLGAFVWQRDRRWEMQESINARPVPTWQYVAGKYLGVVISWSSILIGLILVGSGRAYQLAAQFGLPFALHEFLLPLLPAIGISLLYGTVVILALSLLLRHSIAALLLYFCYWGYVVLDLSMLKQQTGIVKFLSYWFFRSSFVLKPETLAIIQHSQDIRWGNRVLYSLLTGVLLGLTILLYQRLRTQGGLTRMAKPSDLQSLPVWRRRLHGGQAHIQVPSPLRITAPIIALVCYQARLIGHVTIWLAPLIALLLPVVFFLPDFSDTTERVFWALRIAELFAPFLGILICANLLSQEWETDMADLWLTKSFPRSDLLLARLAVGVGMTILVVLLLITQLALTYVPLNWGEALLVTLPPTLFLGILGMLVGLILRNSAVAFLVPIAYWVFEMSTKGVYTRPFYLFARAACFDAVSCAALSSSTDWILPKLSLLSLTFVLVALAMWLLQRVGCAWR